MLFYFLDLKWFELFQCECFYILLLWEIFLCYILIVCFVFSVRSFCCFDVLNPDLVLCFSYFFCFLTVIFFYVPLFLGDFFCFSNPSVFHFYQYFFLNFQKLFFFYYLWVFILHHPFMTFYYGYIVSPFLSSWIISIFSTVLYRMRSWSLSYLCLSWNIKWLSILLLFKDKTYWLWSSLQDDLLGPVFWVTPDVSSFRSSIGMVWVPRKGTTFPT